MPAMSLAEKLARLWEQDPFNHAARRSLIGMAV